MSRLSKETVPVYLPFLGFICCRNLTRFSLMLLAVLVKLLNLKHGSFLDALCATYILKEIRGSKVDILAGLEMGLPSTILISENHSA